MQTSVATQTTNTNTRKCAAAETTQAGHFGINTITAPGSTHPAAFAERKRGPPPTVRASSA
jgi:hypothetical protein